MIKLIDLLKEIQNTSHPKAIFLAGPAGSGKTTTINKLVDISQFNIVNVDDEYEKLLKQSGLGTKQIDFGPEELSQAAKLMGRAQKLTKEKYEELKQQMSNLIIDGTGAASNPLLKKKKELEDLGYECFMVALYVGPITALERNMNRPRSLLPQIVLRTWRDYIQNVETYKQVFNKNFTLINTDDKQTISFDKQYIIDNFFKTIKSKGKEKTQSEKIKSQEQITQLYKDIEQLSNKNFDFDDINKSKSKIQKFLNN